VEDQPWECGATLFRLDTWDTSVPPINAESPDVWQEVEMIFTAESVSEKIGCRLGHWSSIVSGTMFCDDFDISTTNSQGNGDGNADEVEKNGADTMVGDNSTSTDDDEPAVDHTIEMSTGSAVLLVALALPCIFCKPFRQCMCSMCDVCGDPEHGSCDAKIQRDRMAQTSCGRMRQAEAKRHDHTFW